jgi:hypothetical protein
MGKVYAGVARLPHGIGKLMRVAVFTQDPAKVAEAKENGADVVGVRAMQHHTTNTRTPLLQSGARSNSKSIERGHSFRSVHCNTGHDATAWEGRQGESVSRFAPSNDSQVINL